MAEAPPERRRGRRLKWALGLSLALNLIIVGFVAGAIWRFAGPHAPDRMVRDGGANYGTAFVRSLPPRAQRQLHRSLRREAGTLPSRAERRGLYREMLTLLRADTFDAVAVEAIFATQAQTAQRVQTRAQAGWLEIVGGMTREERWEVAARLEAALRRGPRKPKSE